ncbi:hypothetical protein [Legionella brunensis]|uniref:hypothetical protein n=1 Tax=Legionella brunensis TaxID=29422 RepID=UPI001040FC81|nr:hypothetical protein [Legionella brunensis]
MKEIDKKFKELRFKKATPVYEAVKNGNPNDIGFFKRGKKLNGISAFLSLWPDGAGVSKIHAFKSFFKIGGKTPPTFSNKVQQDMFGEWYHSMNDPKHIIEHHRGSEFEVSELSQKKDRLDTRIEELKKQKDAIQDELKKKGCPVKSAVEKRREAQRLEEKNTNDAFDLVTKNFKKEDRDVALARQKEELTTELKTLKSQFHHLLQNADIPKFHGYKEWYRQLTSEFNKNETFYEDAPDSNKVRHFLLLYLQQFNTAPDNENEDARELLSLHQQIKDAMDKIKCIEHEELHIKTLQAQFEAVKTELGALLKERDDVELELDNTEITEGLNPDFTVSLPTSESGLPFVLNEIPILKKMEAIMHDPNFQYDVFDKNCARVVKESIRAGISPATLKAIENLSDFSKGFFDSKFFTTPVGVMEWVLKLNHYLYELNYPELQKSKQDTNEFHP